MDMAFLAMVAPPAMAPAAIASLAAVLANGSLSARTAGLLALIETPEAMKG
jgi:hypothetical protein